MTLVQKMDLASLDLGNTFGVTMMAKNLINAKVGSIDSTKLSIYEDT